MAPQSGAETRAQIAAKGDEWRRVGEEQFQEYRTHAESTVGEVQERARIVLDEGKSRVSKKQENGDEPEVGALEETDDVETIDNNDEGDATG